MGRFSITYCIIKFFVYIYNIIKQNRTDMNIGSDKEYALKGYTIESLLELAYRLGRNSASSDIDVKDMLKCAEKVLERTSAYELIEA